MRIMVAHEGMRTCWRSGGKARNWGVVCEGVNSPSNARNVDVDVDGMWMGTYAWRSAFVNPLALMTRAGPSSLLNLTTAKPLAQDTELVPGDRHDDGAVLLILSVLSTTSLPPSLSSARLLLLPYPRCRLHLRHVHGQSFQAAGYLVRRSWRHWRPLC